MVGEHGVFVAKVCKENSTLKVYVPKGIVKVLRLTEGDEVNIELTKCRAGEFKRRRFA